MNIIKEFINSNSYTVTVIGLIIVFVFLLAYYVLFSYSIYKISKKQDIDNNWMTWVPYLNFYYLGVITNKNYNGLLMLLLICLTSFTKVIWIDIIIYILFAVIFSLTIKKIYKNYYTNIESLTIFTIVSLTLLGPIVLFINRNKKIKKTN